MPSPKPSWLKRPLPRGKNFAHLTAQIRQQGLHTVCQEANCPNRWECLSQGTATFLILGPVCTRRCRFCGIIQDVPSAPNPTEPRQIAAAAKRMGLQHVVVTSTTRDDLTDGGAAYFAATVRSLAAVLPKSTVELLVPDFQGNPHALDILLDTRFHVLNHNVETVPRLYDRVRPGASFQRSLNLLRTAKDTVTGLHLKSGIMLGLGEEDREVEEVLCHLLAAGCTALTIGQYLQPTKWQLPVARYVHPEDFDWWKTHALALGFRDVSSGPLVRSSYKAGRMASLLTGLPVNGAGFETAQGR